MDEKYYLLVGMFVIFLIFSIILAKEDEKKRDEEIAKIFTITPERECKNKSKRKNFRNSKKKKKKRKKKNENKQT